MAGSPPNFHKMDSRSACIQGVLKVKVNVKGHVIRALSCILGMSYSVIDGLVLLLISMLAKESEMLRDVFCKHIMQQNATAAGAQPRTPLGELTALPQPPSCFKGVASRRKGDTGELGEGKGRRGTGGVKEKGGKLE